MNSPEAIAEPAVAPRLTVAPHPAPPAPDRRDWHIAMLSVAVTIVVLSLILSVRDDQRVVITGLAGYPLPETCWMKNLFHCDCPGCGLTRSFVHLAHGNWRQSLSVHRLGWLLAVVVLAQIPYRWTVLRRPAWIVGARWSRGIFITFVAVLVLNWAFNLVTGVRGWNS